MMRRLLSQHTLAECPKRTQPCTYCAKEFVFDTIQVRTGPMGTGPPRWLSVPPPDRCPLSPEPPVPVPPVPRALPQPVRDAQHRAGGHAQPPEGELQHCHAAVSLQGGWLQAPGKCGPSPVPVSPSPSHPGVLTPSSAPQHPQSSALTSVQFLVGFLLCSAPSLWPLGVPILSCVTLPSWCPPRAIPATCPRAIPPRCPCAIPR